MADILAAVAELRELTNNAHLHEASFLLEGLKRVSSMVLERALYIDCVRPNNGAMGGEATRQIRDSARQTRSNNIRHRNVKRKKKGKHNRTRFDLRNTVPVALRGMRLVVEDWQPGRKDTFLYSVTQARLECRQAVLDSAVNFYERGYAKTTSRSRLIMETIQAYMDNVQNELNQIGNEAQKYQVASARELITIVREINTLFIKTCAAVFQRITDAAVGNHEDVSSSLFQKLDDG
jgi:hypothetical protein